MSNHPLDKDEVKKIVDHYRVCNGNPFKIAKEVGHADKTVTKYLKKAGLETGVDHFTGGEVDNIISSYFVFEGVARNASKELNIGHATIVRYWKRADLRTNRYRGHDSPVDFFFANENRFKYATKGEILRTDRGLARTLSRWGLWDFLSSESSHGVGRPLLSDEVTSKIKKMSERGIYNYEIAERLGISKESVEKYKKVKK